VYAHRHALGLIGPFERRQFDPRTSSAKQYGRHVYVQPIETSSRNKARHGISAALNQNPAHSRSGQRGNNCGRSNVSIIRRQGHNFNAGRRRATRSLRRDQQTANTIVGEQSRIGSKTASRIDHSARRLRTGHLSDGQLGIVGQGGSNANDNNIDQSTQPMEMLNARGTIDKL